MITAQAVEIATFKRIRILMRAEPDNPDEVEGVLNPGLCRDRAGRLLAFVRVVARGNYSRILIVQIILDDGNMPIGIQRLGYALEPREPYELHLKADGRHGGGVEDPRVSFIPALDRFLMTYVAFGPDGPRNAIAVSDDAYSWERLGLVKYAVDGYNDTRDMNRVDNKDAVFFDRPVRDSAGVESIAVLHRPTFAPGTFNVPARPSIWISYIPLEEVQRDIGQLTSWSGHRLVAEPREDWEVLKIGAGPPPLATVNGWYLMTHGVSGVLIPGVEQQQGVVYCPGSILLDLDDPGTVIARSTEPLLHPGGIPEERAGVVVPNVFFPTGIDQRDGRILVIHGSGDSSVGIGELIIH